MQLESKAVLVGRRFPQFLMSFSLMIIFVLICGILWYPVVRSTYSSEINYNEGWNSYYATYASLGKALYASESHYIGLNYPPLSFHLVGLVGKLLGDVTRAGRWISLLSLAATAVGVALIVYQGSKSVSASLSAACFCLIWITTYKDGNKYVGMNDPQMLGHAIIMVGVLLYIKKPDSVPFLFCSCLAFCLAGFVKQNLLAFPIAVSLDLLLRSRKRLVLWCFFAILLISLSTLFSVAIDGPYFFQHLLISRSYLFHDAINAYSEFVYAFRIPWLVSLVWFASALWEDRNNFYIYALVTANVIGFFFSGGAGVNVNIFFDCILSMAIMCGIALAELLTLDRHFSLQVQSLVAVCPLLFGISTISQLPGIGLSAFPRNFAIYERDLSQKESLFRSDVQYLKARSGPAICESLLLCFEAGKPFLYDPFFVNEQIKVGRIQEIEVLDDLRATRFSTIQLNGSINEPQDPNGRFSKAFMETLLLYYQVDRRTESRVFLVPKPTSS